MNCFENSCVNWTLQTLNYLPLKGGKRLKEAGKATKNERTKMKRSKYTNKNNKSGSAPKKNHNCEEKQNEREWKCTGRKNRGIAKRFCQYRSRRTCGILVITSFLLNKRKRKTSQKKKQRIPA